MTAPQSADSHLPEESMFIFSGLPWTTVLTAIFMLYASEPVKVICPSPLDGGLVQVKDIFMVLPERGEVLDLQSPRCWAGY